MNFQKKISLLLIVFIFCFAAKPEIIEKQNTLSLYLNISQASSFTGKVTYVNDGDTVEVLRDDNGVTEKIRMLGINTPEERYKDDSGNWVYDPEPYAEDAFNYTFNLVKDKTVTVYFATDQYYQRDPYNRVLGVVVINGRILNIELLRNGLAKRYFYNENPILKFDEWVKAEASARLRRINLWSHYHENRIVITEVYPDPPGDEDLISNPSENQPREFFEIKNFGKKPVNLKNWLIMLNRSTHYETLTENDIILNPEDTCIISMVSESTFRNLFPTMPQNTKYIEFIPYVFRYYDEPHEYFVNNPQPPGQRILYLVTPDKYIEEVLTFDLDWYDGLRNGGKSLQRVKFRDIETGEAGNNSPDKELFKADTPNPGAIQ